MIHAVIATLAFMMFSSVAEVWLGLPRLANFAHLPLVLLLFLVSLRRLTAAARPLAVGCLLLAAVFLLSAMVNEAGLINAVVGYLLLCEPLLLLTVLVNSRPRRFEVRQLGRALLFLGLAQVPFALAQTPIAIQYQDSDLVKGTFVGMVVGHHIAGSIALAGAAFVLSAFSVRPYWLQWLLALLLFLVTILSDSKQAIAAALAAAILAWAVRAGRGSGRVAGAAGLTVAIGAVLVIFAVLYPQAYFFHLGYVWLGLVGKLAVVPLLASHFESAWQWLLGVGPGHGVSRLGGWLLERYWTVLGSLGATRGEIATLAWGISGRYGHVSSIFSPLFSWAGVFGEIGLAGLLAYLLMLLHIFRRFCVDELSRGLLLALLPLGLLFEWLEEPHLTLYLMAVIAQRWLAQQAAMQAVSESEDAPRLAVLVPAIAFAWHPFLAAMAQRFPQMRVFLGEWSGYARGLDGSFTVEVVGRQRALGQDLSATGYRTWFTYASPRIVPRLLSYRPDVVFTHSFGVWSLAAILLKPIGGWRLILSYEGSSPGVDFADAPLRLTLRRCMAALADGFVTNTQRGAEYLQRTLGVAPSRICAHPYIVPRLEALGDDLPLAVTTELRRPIFVFVGALVPRKNVRTLLDACALLRQRGHDRFGVVIVGEGGERARLIEQAAGSLAPEQIVWAGQVPYGEIGRWMRAADVFVLPSFEDTLATVVLEAMLCGRPVLCSKAAGASELVVDGDNGFRFDPGSAAELAERMQRFLDTPELAAQLGERARRTMALYTPELAAARLAAMVAAFDHKPVADAEALQAVAAPTGSGA